MATNLLDFDLEGLVAFCEGLVGRKQMVAKLDTQCDVGPGIGCHGIQLVGDRLEVIGQRPDHQAVLGIAVAIVLVQPPRQLPAQIAPLVVVH